MRKEFPCGHRGKGQYCHRCKQLADLGVEEAERKQLAAVRAQRAEQLMREQKIALEAKKQLEVKKLAKAEREAQARREANALRRAEMSAARKQRHELASQDVIPLDHLPPGVKDKARSVLRRIQNGDSFASVGGKRLIDRTVISIPLGMRWRLVLRETMEGFIPVEAMSHEKYNRICTRVQS